MIQVGCPLRGVRFGGNANNATNAGFVYSNTNNAPSNTNANIGSRKCFRYTHGSRLCVECGATALPLGKKYKLNIVGVGRGNPKAPKHKQRK